jgi:hypothetical protein
VEQMREAIKKEIRAIEEEFLVDPSGPREQGREGAQEEQAPVLDKQKETILCGAAEQPGGGNAQKSSQKEGSPMETLPRQEVVYIPGTDPTLRTVKVSETRDSDPKKTRPHGSTKTLMSYARN